MRLVYDALTINPGTASEALIAWTIASAMARKYPVTVITTVERAQLLPAQLPFKLVTVKYNWGDVLPLNGGVDYTYRIYSERVAMELSKIWTPDTIVHRLNPMGIRYGNRYTAMFDKTVIGPLGRSTWAPGFPMKPFDWLTERVKATDFVRLSMQSSLLRRTYEDASVILVSTDSVRESLPKSVWPKCVLQPDGVDIRKYTVRPIVRTDTANILFVGRLLAWKGLAYLLRGLAECKDLRWRLVVAGDGVERHRLESLAAELGLRDRVEFAGWVDNGRMHELYAASTFCCLPAINESVGTANLEAMASGRAVVAADWAGPRLAVGTDAGMLVSVADPERYHLRLAEAIRQLIGDADMCERLGSAGRRLVERRNDWPVVLEKLDSVYKRLWDATPCDTTHSSSVRGVL